MLRLCRLPSLEFQTLYLFVRSMRQNQRNETESLRMVSPSSVLSKFVGYLLGRRLLRAIGNLIRKICWIIRKYAVSLANTKFQVEMKLKLLWHILTFDSFVDRWRIFLIVSRGQFRDFVIRFR